MITAMQKQVKRAAVWSRIYEGAVIMSFYLKTSFVFLSLFLWVGCATLSGIESEQNLQKISTGQTQSQVLNLLGTPDSVIVAHENEPASRWIYNFKNSERKGQHLFVAFQNGRVKEFGEIRARDVASTEAEATSGTCTRRPYKDFFEQSLCVHR